MLAFNWSRMFAFSSFKRRLIFWRESKAFHTINFDETMTFLFQNQCSLNENMKMNFVILLKFSYKLTLISLEGFGVGKRGVINVPPP